MNIEFINHACFSVEEGGEMLMFDPWFFGKVFNDSWSLIKETNIHDLDLRKLKYILISHEHPDHLHWPTLREIRKICDQDIFLIVPKRNNKNVVKEILKLGFKCAEIAPNKQYNIGKFKVTNFPTGHDSAYVVKCRDKTILNQNDCKLSERQVLDIVKNYNKIDYYFVQFSLAGYYANKDDKSSLLEAHDSHIKMIEYYRERFNPKVTIPFASYVYFCREENCFLNDYMVGLGNLESSYQLLTYGDSIVDIDCSERNKRNIELWKKNLSNIKIYKSTIKSEDDILKEARNFMSTVDYNLGKLVFSFYDLKNNIVLDYENKTIYFEEQSDGLVVAKVSSLDIYSFFKFPWGADTMNITSCFEVYERDMWKKNLILKDKMYNR